MMQYNGQQQPPFGGIGDRIEAMDSGMADRVVQLENSFHSLDEVVTQLRNQVWFLNFEEVVSQLRNDLRYTAQRCREECDELRRQLQSLEATVAAEATGAGPPKKEAPPDRGGKGDKDDSKKGKGKDGKDRDDWGGKGQGDDWWWDDWGEWDYWEPWQDYQDDWWGGDWGYDSWGKDGGKDRGKGGGKDRGKGDRDEKGGKGKDGKDDKPGKGKGKDDKKDEKGGKAEKAEKGEKGKGKGKEEKESKGKGKSDGKGKDKDGKEKGKDSRRRQKKDSDDDDEDEDDALDDSPSEQSEDEAADKTVEPTVGSSFGNYDLEKTVSKDRNMMRVDLSHWNLGDDGIKKWVDWAIDRTWDGPVDQLAIDKNNLTEHGMEQIFRFAQKVSCRKIKLHANKLGNGAASWLIKLLQHGAEDKDNGPVRELHLSHNKLGLPAAKELVTEALATEAYPFKAAGTGGAGTPLWLRIEKNAFKKFPDDIEGVCLVNPSLGKRRVCSPFTCKFGKKIHVLADC